jgi:hypothetical protein
VYGAGTDVIRWREVCGNLLSYNGNGALRKAGSIEPMIRDCRKVGEIGINRASFHNQPFFCLRGAV